MECPFGADVYVSLCSSSCVSLHSARVVGGWKGGMRTCTFSGIYRWDGGRETGKYQIVGDAKAYRNSLCTSDMTAVSRSMVVDHYVKPMPCMFSITTELVVGKLKVHLQFQYCFITCARLQ